MNTKILVTAGILILLVGGVFLALEDKNSLYGENGASTSTPSHTTSSYTGTLTGTVTIGPLCPVEPCSPHPEAYTSRRAIVYAANGTTLIAQENLTREGGYSFALPPGTYFVTILPQGIRTLPARPVTITTGAVSTVNFDIDTGIR